MWMSRMAQGILAAFTIVGMTLTTTGAAAAETLPPPRPESEAPAAPSKEATRGTENYTPDKKDAWWVGGNILECSWTGCSMILTKGNTRGMANWLAQNTTAGNISGVCGLTGLANGWGALACVALRRERKVRQVLRGRSGPHGDHVQDFVVAGNVA